MGEMFYGSRTAHDGKSDHATLRRGNDSQSRNKPRRVQQHFMITTFVIHALGPDDTVVWAFVQAASANEARVAALECGLRNAIIEGPANAAPNTLIHALGTMRTAPQR
jgi:hypothetical protein